MRRQNSRVVAVDASVSSLRAIFGLGQLAEKIGQATVLDISQRDRYIVIQRNDDFSLICDWFLIITPPSLRTQIN